MITIKEIATSLGVSPSTVSIVLTGKGNERKISPATQERIQKAALKLGYTPSIAARRLRSTIAGTDESLVFAVFWADDFRAGMMVRFLRGLRQGINQCERPIRMMLFTYTNGELYKEKVLASRTECHAAIVCNASLKDKKFLESTDLPIPIVLYNRYSQKYATVNVDDGKMGRLCAEALADNGCKKVAIITSAPAYPGMARRTSAFKETATMRGLQISPSYCCDNSLQGGYNALCSQYLKEIPDGLFCGSDNIALGALRALWEKGLTVPGDIRVVSIGNGDRDYEEYCIPKLSVVYLPMEKMASECLFLLLDVLDGKVNPPCSRELEVEYIPRESCGGLTIVDPGNLTGV
jgi:LacI family transcriptional regulator